MKLSANLKSKSDIMARLRETSVPDSELPEVLVGDWLRFDDPIAKIGEIVRMVGGECKVVSSLSEIHNDLLTYDNFRDAKSIWSNTDAIPSNVRLDSIARPHDLDTVDFAIYKSTLGVAENAAVWVTDEDIKHRVVFFIAQHLILILNRSSIVHNLHEAYAQLKVRKPGFGCFISGPSKTADIEQSLVIGAHGCRSMQMYIVED